MCKTAVEEHRVLDQAIEGRMADDLALSGTSRMVSETHNVRPADVNIRISLHEVYLCYDSLCHADIIRIHPCDKVCLHVHGNLDARVQRLWQPSVL